jgi:hypothetical protein
MMTAAILARRIIQIALPSTTRGPAAHPGSVVRGDQQTQLSSTQRDRRERPAPVDNTTAASKAPLLPSSAPAEDTVRRNMENWGR